MTAISWYNTQPIESFTYTCGYCGKVVAPNQGYFPLSQPERIYICPSCSKPTFIGQNQQAPGAPFGNDVNYVPTDVDSLYREARRCMTVAAHTAAVLTCRKLLMHIAVAEGADAGKAFTVYVDFLVNNFVTLKAYSWVDHIRKQSNKPNHEVVQMSQQDAQEILAFSEMLLRLVYEFPQRIAPVQTATT